MPDKKINVLVVDDDPELVRIIKMSLESMGCQAFVAADGVEAIKILNEKPIELVMSDINMPRMNGLSLLEAVNAKGLDIPVVLMSGDTEASEAEVDKRGGAILLMKPFSRSQIKEIIEIYC